MKEAENRYASTLFQSSTKNNTIEEFEKFLSKENEHEHREQIYGEQQVLIPQLHWYQAQLKSAQFAVNVS